MYYRARWYDPQQGRFVSEHPIGLPGGINLFAYVGNNPMSFYDPSGLCAQKKLDPNSPEYLALAKKIANIRRDIIETADAIIKNPQGLPETAPGPRRNSTQGHKEI